MSTIRCLDTENRTLLVNLVLELGLVGTAHEGQGDAAVYEHVQEVVHVLRYFLSGCQCRASTLREGVKVPSMSNRKIIFLAADAAAFILILSFLIQSSIT